MSGRLHSPCKTVDSFRRASTYLVSIAGSAGAFAPLRDVLAAVPAALDAAIVAMLHTGPGSSLPEALAVRCQLPVLPAVTGELLEPGVVYVAPHGSHVIVNPDARFTVWTGPRRRLFRPSADWLFESAAASFGPRHTAVVLSGLLCDGSASLRMVKRLGGTVLVQAPASATFPDMPSAAIATGQVDRIVAPAEMAHAICEMVSARNAVRDRAAWDDPFGTSEVA